MTTMRLQCAECNEMFEVSTPVAEAMHHWNARKIEEARFSVSSAQRRSHGETQF